MATNYKLGLNVPGAEGNSYTNYKLGQGVPTTSPAPAPSHHDSNISADDLNAAITRGQYAYYKKHYFPIENEAIAALDNDSLADHVKDARENVQQGLKISSDMTDRQLGRYGLTQTPQEHAAMEREQNLQGSLATVNAENTARQGYNDQDMNFRQELVGYGRNLASSAAQTSGQAAGLEANREATNRNLKAQDKAQTYQAIGTAAGLGIAALALL